jgi:hypothetical protein
MSKQRRPSITVLAASWAIALLSVGLLIPTGAAVGIEATSFRSCDVNNAGLFVHACGKQSFNLGDALIAVLFLGSIAVVGSLFTHAWRLTRRRP